MQYNKLPKVQSRLIVKKIENRFCQITQCFKKIINSAIFESGSYPMSLQFILLVCCLLFIRNFHRNHGTYFYQPDQVPSLSFVRKKFFFVQTLSINVCWHACYICLKKKYLTFSQNVRKGKDQTYMFVLYMYLCHEICAFQRHIMINHILEKLYGLLRNSKTLQRS